MLKEHEGVVLGRETVRHILRRAGRPPKRDVVHPGTNPVDPEKLAEIKDEIGDVLIYLVRLADELGIDPLEAANQKLEKNEKKYPADKVKGKALKYDEYPDE